MPLGRESRWRHVTAAWKRSWFTPENRARWHNLKYYTWVEQQGKTVEELDAQRDPEWWLAHQARVSEIDARLIAAREKLPANR